MNYGAGWQIDIVNKVRLGREQLSRTVEADFPLSFIEPGVRNPAFLDDVGLTDISVVVTALPSAGACLGANIRRSVTLR